jgi:uncharacterized repeat protein (TIGR01451 family)
MVSFNNLTATEKSVAVRLSVINHSKPQENKMKNTDKKHYFKTTLTLLFVLSGMVVFAAQNEAVGRALNLIKPEVRVQISGTVQRDNRTLSLDKADAVKSGEILDWKINSVNNGNASAQNYRVVGQIPAGTVYVAGTAKAEDEPQISYSIDGGRSFSAQPLIDEKQADGSVKKVPAPVSMYSQIKFEWAKDLPVQSQIGAVYRVRVK